MQAYVRHKYRDYVFTYNNPKEAPDEFAQKLKRVAGDTLVFVVFQLERGEEGGTPHYQGFFRFRNPRGERLVRKWFGWHIERRRGSPQQALDYATKSDTRESGPYWFPNEEFVRIRYKDQYRWEILP